ncbi:RteC domain-containing protein [Algoriphagus aestuarii]|nr:RteC domain-containing protein [Algoriphagus aestuarii]
MIENEAFNILFLEMKQKINELVETSPNRLAAAEQSFLIANEYCEKVSAPEKFDSPLKEIYFYKQIRPSFEAELIYFGEVYFILSFFPPRRKDAIKFLNQQFLTIHRFRTRNHVLYDYFRLNKKDQDEVFFTKTKLNSPIWLTKTLPLGDRNATPAGKVIARFLAFQELEGFLQKMKSELEGNTEQLSGPIKWTASKAALVELAYALKATGAVNHGNVTIRDIANHLEKVFQRDLSQFYRTFQEIRIRKNSRTTFLDRLKDKLEKWMDNTDFDGKGEL